MYTICDGIEDSINVSQATEVIVQEKGKSVNEKMIESKKIIIENTVQDLLDNLLFSTKLVKLQQQISCYKFKKCGELSFEVIYVKNTSWHQRGNDLNRLP